MKGDVEKMFEKKWEEDSGTAFMNSFMGELKNNDFHKNNQSDDEPDITPEFIEDQLASYSRLLNSDIFKEASRKMEDDGTLNDGDIDGDDYGGDEIYND